MAPFLPCLLVAVVSVFASSGAQYDHPLVLDRLYNGHPQSVRHVNATPEMTVGYTYEPHRVTTSEPIPIANVTIPMENVTDSCEAIMHHFASQGGNFTNCMLNHARPFRVCEECVTHYTKFTHLYEDLLTNTLCSKLLLLADRVQVMTAIYRAFTATWTDASCNQCYSSVALNSTTGKVTYTFTPETLLFQQMNANVSACFANQSRELEVGAVNNSVVCRDCRTVYRTMNNYYINFKDSVGGHVCMDLVDMMNSTRLQWSNKFQCSRPVPSATWVIVICTVSFVTVILFYISRPFLANIRRHDIFKGKRMATGGYGTLREDASDRSLSQEVSDRSLPSFATSLNVARRVQRADSYRNVDGNGHTASIEDTG